MSKSKANNLDSIARRARALGALSRELSRVNRTLRRMAAGPRQPAISGASVRAMVGARRLRDGCFDPAIGDLA